MKNKIQLFALISLLFALVLYLCTAFISATWNIIDIDMCPKLIITVIWGMCTILSGVNIFTD